MAEHGAGELDVAAELARARSALDSVADEPGEASLEALMRGPVQRMLASAVRLYAACRELDADVEAFDRSSEAPSATAVLITVSALLEAVEVEPFELGLWMAWGTRGGARLPPAGT